MTNGLSTTEDTRAIDLLKASGLLNANVTLDKLMDVSRRLAELEPASTMTHAGPVERPSVQVFLGAYYYYTSVRR
jgi:hypothetical protein